MQQPIDILVLSNGPGELATWVKPMVRELRHQLGDDRTQVRISVVLSPCANASGREAAIAQGYPEVDRVQAASDFFPFLVWGKTADDWDWRSQGVVLFLGGDQFFPVVIGKRLGYRTVIYAEWEARWHRWVDYFGVMNDQVINPVKPELRHKFAVVGDLMAEAGQAADGEKTAHDDAPLIGILPGSKAMKLVLGMPLFLAIAEHIKTAYPHARFAIPVAPALSFEALAAYGNPEQNAIIHKFGWAEVELVKPPGGDAYLKTGKGLHVDLWREFPAYARLSDCTFCLTTVGANTAELGSLGVPMFVILPTQQLDVMRAWDGIPGLLANLPGVGSTFAKMINRRFLAKRGLLAWPNIWAKSEIVPELVGELDPKQVADQIITYLDQPAQLEAMRSRLRQARGTPGAAQKLVQLVKQALDAQVA